MHTYDTCMVGSERYKHYEYHCALSAKTAFLHSEDASMNKHERSYIYKFVDQAIKMQGGNCGANHHK